MIKTFLLASIALAAILPAARAGDPDPPQQRMTIGITPSGVGFTTREWHFANIFNSARHWQSNQPIAYHPDGWPDLEPGQSVNTLMHRGMNGHYPAGTYTVRWDGTGTVAIAGFDVDGASWGAPIADTTGEFTFDVTNPANGGIALRIDASDDADHVRNIRVYPPGIDPDNAPTFHPTFLERLEPFEFIRFLSWCGVGQTTGDVQWADRPLPTDPTQSTVRGVSLEHMIELCNTLDVDPWFCMPHLATDDYMQQFAAFVHANLEPERTVYIEFSNEVWNFIYPQAVWNATQAGMQGINRFHHYANMSLRTFDIWEAEFGPDYPDRLVRVVGTQRGHHAVSDGILEHIPEGEADALAPAAYFYVNATLGPDDITADTPLDVIFDAAEIGIYGTGNPDIIFGADETLDEFAREQVVADAKGMDVISYEGGQHLVSTFAPGHPAEERFAAANQHPKMGHLYFDFLRELDAMGIEGFTHLGYISDQDSPDGAWGLLDHQTQSRDEAWKWNAVLCFIEGCPDCARWDFNLDGAVNAFDLAALLSGWPIFETEDLSAFLGCWGKYSDAE